MAYLDRHTPSASEVLAAFADAMRQRGLIPPDDLIADGRLHRCRVGTRGSSIKNADYDNDCVRTWVPS
jgi:hypothetical protein